MPDPTRTQPLHSGTHAPRECASCGRDDVPVCCSSATYDDGTHDEPIGACCCVCPSAFRFRASEQPSRADGPPFDHATATGMYDRECA